ncbi:MAG: NAD(P)-dependent oxidoreductase [Rhodospirillaceae bacterium]|nr:NAD(P)-dependent oxidoreductase [Rhodospirillaceae bacterium]
MRLEGKTAMVTAAAQGIGRATALAFAREGAKVWATDINADKVKDIAGERIETMRLDVTDVAAVSAVAAHTGPVDILFNCAGYVADGALLDCELEDWDRSFELNVRAMMLVTRAFLPDMVRKRSGAIVNIASVASSLKGVKNRAAYSASKAAVIGLTKSVAMDYIGQGIRCNAICPGTVDTPSLQDRINAFEDAEEARRMFIARQPMGRLGTAEEIAEAAVYLASDEASFMTGQTLVVDGGLTL